MPVNVEQSVRDLAEQHPDAARVLAKHQIDVARDGDKSLQAACAERGVEAMAVAADLARSGRGRHDGWEHRSNEELIGYIFDRFHVPLIPELRRLEALATKVARVHRDKEPQRLLAIAETVSALLHDMEHHLEEEEAVIFPWVLSGGAGAEGRMKAVGHDHRSHAWALAELRRLTRNYEIPAEACASWTALWVGLEQLEADLVEHIRLEDQVLFPRLLSR